MQNWISQTDHVGTTNLLWWSTQLFVLCCEVVVGINIRQTVKIAITRSLKETAGSEPTTSYVSSNTQKNNWTGVWNNKWNRDHSTLRYKIISRTIGSSSWSSPPHSDNPLQSPDVDHLIPPTCYLFPYTGCGPRCTHLTQRLCTLIEWWHTLQSCQNLASYVCLDYLTALLFNWLFQPSYL